MIIPPDELSRMKEKYPKSCFIIATASQRCNLPPLQKCKFIIPKTVTVGYFIHILRKRMNLTPDKALFIFINNTIPVITQTISEVERLFGVNGVINIQYMSESTFGFK